MFLRDTSLFLLMKGVKKSKFKIICILLALHYIYVQNLECRITIYLSGTGMFSK